MNQSLLPLLDWARKELQHLENGHQEAYWIWQDMFYPLEKLSSDSAQEISPLHQEIFVNRVQHRKSLYPLDYLLGKSYFADIEIEIYPGVFIPRPDTLCAVEWMIQNLRQEARILEIGVGSGACLVKLQKDRDDFVLIGSDISPTAILCAHKNYENYFASREQKRKLQLYRLAFPEESFPLPKNFFDMIWNNPPYVSEEEYFFYRDEIQFEPKQAFVPKEKDPILPYVQIAEKGIGLLKENGYICVEISPWRQDEIIQVFETRNYRPITTLLDVFGKNRALVFQK